MDMQAKLGNALFSGLTKLRNEKGSFDMNDVGALFEQLSATLPHADGIDHSVHDEISKLALFIAQTKNDIYSIGHQENGKTATGDATQHLDAIIKGTEEASNTILDAADSIQAAAGSLSGDAQKTICDAVTKIYEACNFQDLTGQRVNKVIKTLNEIDTRINSILSLFGSPGSAPMQLKKTLTEDEKLLNGPQLPGSAPSQADIDALFSGGKPS